MTASFFKPTLLMMQKAFPGKSQILRNFPGSRTKPSDALFLQKGGCSIRHHLTSQDDVFIMAVF